MYIMGYSQITWLTPWSSKIIGISCALKTQATCLKLSEPIFNFSAIIFPPDLLAEQQKKADLENSINDLVQQDENLKILIDDTIRTTEELERQKADLIGLINTTETKLTTERNKLNDQQNQDHFLGAQINQIRIYVNKNDT